MRRRLGAWIARVSHEVNRHIDDANSLPKLLTLLVHVFASLPHFILVARAAGGALQAFLKGLNEFSGDQGMGTHASIVERSSRRVKSAKMTIAKTTGLPPGKLTE